MVLNSRFLLYIKSNIYLNLISFPTPHSNVPKSAGKSSTSLPSILSIARNFPSSSVTVITMDTARLASLLWPTRIRYCSTVGTP